MNFDTLYCRPAPFARAHFPVWLAGPPTAKGADRVARLGQGWLPFGNLTAADIKKGAAHLREAEVKHGLAPHALGIWTALPTTPGPDIDGMLDAAFATAPAYVAAGATHLQLPLWRYLRTMSDVAKVIRGARNRLDACCGG